jgi:hypothetical protein
MFILSRYPAACYGEVHFGFTVCDEVACGYYCWSRCKDSRGHVERYGETAYQSLSRSGTALPCRSMLLNASASSCSL